MTPSSELYSSLQIAYTHFNEMLFDGQLPEVIFTVQRHKGVMGYFSPKRWGSLAGRKCDEIAINPSYVGNCRLIEVMQTLVHEMVHHLQNMAGMKYACPAAREKLAYAAQQEWLELTGVDFFRSFETDRMTLLVRTTCGL